MTCKKLKQVKWRSSNSFNYLKLLDLQFSKCVTNVLWEVPYYTDVSKEEGEISDTGTFENHLLSFEKSIVVDYK